MAYAKHILVNLIGGMTLTINDEGAAPNVLEAIQKAIPMPPANGDGCPKFPMPICSLSDGHDFVHAILTGSMPAWLEAQGIDPKKSALDPQQIIAIVKAVCAVVGPLCQAVNSL